MPSTILGSILTTTLGNLNRLFRLHSLHEAEYSLSAHHSGRPQFSPNCGISGAKVSNDQILPSVVERGMDGEQPGTTIWIAPS